MENIEKTLDKIIFHHKVNEVLLFLIGILIGFVLGLIFPLIY